MSNPDMLRGINMGWEHVNSLVKVQDFFVRDEHMFNEL